MFFHYLKISEFNSWTLCEGINKRKHLNLDHQNQRKNKPADTLGLSKKWKNISIIREKVSALIKAEIVR